MFRRKIKKMLSDRKYKKIYERFASYTMIPQKYFIDNLILAEKFRNIEGDIVECGVWKGGMIAGIAYLIGDGKQYYLFDSFEGLPEAQEIDGENAIKWQKNITGKTYFNNCKAELSDAEEAMRISGVKNYYCIKGWFKDTLNYPQRRTEEISILRLDADWYDSMYLCLENLFPLISKGGLLIIDDYYIWEGTSRAVHDYLSKYKLGNKIYQLNKGIAYIIK